MRKIALTLAMTTLLASACALDVAAVIRGALLSLDASDNPAYPKGWTNHGEVGGQLSSGNNPPEEDEGPIKIPDLGINERLVPFYTFKKSGQCFGVQGDKVVLPLEDWTVEFLLRRNGDKLGDEHHLAGFQNAPVEGAQGVRLNFWGGAGELTWSVHAGGGKAGTSPLKIILEEGAWNWIALSHQKKKKLVAYQNGKRVSEQGGFNWSDKKPINVVIIGANSYGERGRTFNGSVAIVRVYDKALTEKEVNHNIREAFAVEAADKLATTWARMKNGS